MKSNDLDSIWLDVENQKSDKTTMHQRMVCVEMLYRVYVGASGSPARRALILEIPEKEIVQFDSFSEPKGFTLQIQEPAVKHTGYTSCILQSASHDLNDVFTIVAKDILSELLTQRDSEAYVSSLKKRIEKWREFFKNSSTRKLSDEMVIGLWGELLLISKLQNAGIMLVPDIWNGPIKSAQDFQGNGVALEVKTTTTAMLNHVNISSEVQLDDSGKNALFLVAYRIEKSATSGLSLPELVDTVASQMSPTQTKRFFAALVCLGYIHENAHLYTKHYHLKEEKYFHVKDGFPRLLRGNLPVGIHDLKYCISLSHCSDYLSDLDNVVSAIKEYEYE